MITHRSLNAMLLLAATSLLASCGKQDADDELPGENMLGGEATVPGTKVELIADDPLADGWETESWTADIQSRLDLIKSALISGEIEAAVAEVAGDQTRSTRLVPEDLEQADARVARLAPGTEVPHARSLGIALDELRDLFSPGPRHASAKIVGITSVAPDVADTRIKFQVDGESGAGGLQVNATWECRWQRDGDSWGLGSVRLGAFEQVLAPKGAFADATEAVLGGDDTFKAQFYRGLDHWMARIEMRLGVDVTGWQGLAVADIDGDGLEDIYVSQPGGLPNRLYRHQADGTLEDVSAQFGVDWLDTTHGSLFADLDNDGDPDLLVGVADGIAIMENKGAGFELRATKLLPAGLAYSIAAADFDQNGYLDFFICGYTAGAGVSRHHLFVHPVPYHDANNGGRNSLFRNDGEWRFVDVTRACGLEEHNTRFSYSASWEDYDLDGDLDLYIANDFGRNSLYRNELAQTGRARLTDVADAAGVVDISAGMSACWGDYDNDGHPDLYVGNMFSSAGNRIATQPEFHAGADAQTRSEFLRHARGNSLFRNTGDGTFADVGEELGVAVGRWAWSSKFADLDNDGWQDIIVANGFITQESSDDL